MLQDVNVVSAPSIARERGVVIEETIREAEGEYDALITLSVTTDTQTRSVAGTVFAGGRPRIVAIKEIKVDAELAPSMLYVSNEDKPGFIGRFASILGEAGVNIATFALGRDRPGGSAIALVEVDGVVPEKAIAAVKDIAGVKQVKSLSFA